MVWCIPLGEGVPKLELLSCLCEPDRAKQSPTLQEIAHLHCNKRSAAQVSA